MGILTLDELHKRISYDPATGVSTHLVSTRRRKAGAVAGRIDHEGYRVLGVYGARYRHARLVWFYMTGRWPNGEIDHRDGDRANDRWANLRECSRQQNAANGKRRRINGPKGAYWSQNRWASYISVHGKQLYLGRFWTEIEAAQAYKNAAREHFGEFARP